MPYFLDSGVIIGYIFDIADPFGKQAKAVISSQEEKYFGPTARNECFGIDENGRCNTIIHDISNEFRRAIKELKNNLPINELLDLIREKKWRTCEILSKLIDNYKTNIRLLVDMIRTSQEVFEADCDFRRDEIDNVVQFCDRTLPYIEVRDKLEGFIPDLDDVPIILDAHHVGLGISNLKLVSGNRWDITAFKSLICRSTSLADVIYLKYFDKSVV